MQWAYEHTNYFKNKKDELGQMRAHSSIKKYLEECGLSDYIVGYWTILKNISLAYCINPFGVILESNRIQNTICLDLFCGAGITPLKGPQSEKSEWIVGSPIILTRMTNYPFKAYYFGDINKRALQLVDEILNEWNETSKEKRNYEIYQGDANAVLKNIHPSIKGKYVFAFIDPSGFQWDWDSMELLLNLNRFDIIMNFQTRQVDRIPREKEISFFGPCAAKIRNLSNCDEKLDEYIQQIEDMGLKVTPVRIGMDRSNQYYYHLLHISRLDSYKSIIKSLKNRVERFDGKSIKMVWDDLHGYSVQTSLQTD